MIKGGKVVKSMTPPEAIANTMVKKVNIIARFPVKTMCPPIYGSFRGITMSSSNICKCLAYRAVVEEILADGSTIRLDMTNYNKINSLEDPDVQQKILENRARAVLGETYSEHITGANLINHTAPLPRNHYLFTMKEKCPSVPFPDPREMMEKGLEETKAKGQADCYTKPEQHSTLPTIDPVTKVVEGAEPGQTEAEAEQPEEYDRHNQTIME